MRLGSRRPSRADAPRLGALAILPVFLPLRGAPVVVIGGSAAAAWKAECTLAAGAAVTIFAPEPGVEMRAFLGSASDPIVHLERIWRMEDLADAILVIADVEEEEAARLRLATRECRALLNVVDKSAFCDFQFGAIVNRSPVVIGISTDGAAPVLAQAIRRRIEAMLSPATAVWAAAAARLRAEYAERGVRLGRPFWERFVDLALGEAPSDTGDAVSRLAALAAGNAARPAGAVTIVGTGPEGSDLLTLRAIRAMQAADVLVFEQPMPADILELARREADRCDVSGAVAAVGGRQRAAAQMAERAARGLQVVRLIRGAPRANGQEYEEIDELCRRGVKIDVVPGVGDERGSAAPLRAAAFPPKRYITRAGATNRPGKSSRQTASTKK